MDLSTSFIDIDHCICISIVSFKHLAQHVKTVQIKIAQSYNTLVTIDI
jgi:hypothetical protein